MKFTQYYLDCLSHASYLIGDETTGRAVVVDPRRDVAGYLADAEAAGLHIDLVVETHFHADFLSGHLELAAATGAEIAYGQAAQADFPIRRLADGERISLGQVTLQALATPGHTPESVSLVVYEHPDDTVPYGVLTGDTLFIGDVGRPDLLGSLGHTAEQMGRMLYHSLHDTLLTLPDATRVFPAHGAGSACGKALSTETSSTLGDQRRSNYALAPMSEDEFVAVVTEGQPAAPGYFRYDAVRNRQPHQLLDENIPPRALSLDDVRAAVRDGAVVLDTRDPADYTAGHLTGSLSVSLGGRFAEQAGSVIEPERPIVLVSIPGTAQEARLRLARIGFDTVLGALADPSAVLTDHPETVTRSSRLTVAQLDERRRSIGDLLVLDVRNPGETRSGTIPGALTLPLGTLRTTLDQLDPARPTVVYCASGNRSVSAAGLLTARGFTDVSDLLGGYTAYQRAHSATAPTCTTAGSPADARA